MAMVPSVTPRKALLAGAACLTTPVIRGGAALPEDDCQVAFTAMPPPPAGTPNSAAVKVCEPRPCSVTENPPLPGAAVVVKRNVTGSASRFWTVTDPYHGPVSPIDEPFGTNGKNSH